MGYGGVKVMGHVTCHWISPPPAIRVRPKEGTENEAFKIYARADHQHRGQHEAGAKCADLRCKDGVSEGTFYNWKAKFGGMTVSETKRLKVLEDENAKLKKLLGEQMLDLSAMKNIWFQKSGRPRREARSRCSTSGQTWPVGTANLSHAINKA